MGPEMPAWQPSPGASSITPIDLEEVGKIAQAASSIALECTKAVPDITVERIRKKMSGEIEPLLDEVRTA